ncbi:hypothetical protein, partial [Nocardia abscessus]|uniref:hypothetical protein n=1 Tax=Nocardia abscessus TaxID=120957 RepID=UPI00245906C8
MPPSRSERDRDQLTPARPRPFPSRLGEPRVAEAVARGQLATPPNRVGTIRPLLAGLPERERRILTMR